MTQDREGLNDPDATVLDSISQYGGVVNGGGVEAVLVRLDGDLVKAYMVVRRKRRRKSLTWVVSCDRITVATKAKTKESGAGRERE